MKTIPQLQQMCADKRPGLIAEDLVKHWEARWEAMDGKAMIVCIRANSRKSDHE